MEISPCRAAEAPEFGGLAGLELQHDLHLSLGDWTRWGAVADLLATAGADLQSLQMSRLDAGFAASCRVKRLSAESARALVANLLNGGFAQRASVEHLMLARRGAP